ncbi:MAG: chitobiase/beta-hexosaminidase C-terminal domain-containing protein [Bacteroidales bacterium]|nr:chitobiase/beta-hexosaminidase C-terminal domain-containing protein [Bacteroidales bacterium]
MIRNKFFIAGAFFTCVGLFLGSGKMIAQEQLKHEKKIWVSPEGRIYINKDLPVYLRLSTSPNEGAESVLLKSEVTTQYSNPMYFDTEGYNTVRSPSCVDTVTKKTVIPQQDIIFEVYADSKSPETKADFGGAYSYQKDGKTHCKGGLELVLKAKDEVSGVEAIYYSIDGAVFKKYTAPISINQQKEYTIKYYAVDYVGNAEEIQNKIVVVDMTVPKTSLKIEGDSYNNIISGRSFLVLSAEDEHGLDKTLYSIDEGDMKTYTYKINAAYLSQGEHKIRYYSIDEVKNEEPLKEYSFYVDKTPPVIVEELVGNTMIINGKEFSSGRTKLKLTTFDNKAGVKEIYYSINSEDYQLYTEPFYLSTASGNIKLKTYAVDNVNNKSSAAGQSERSSIPYIDLSGPSVLYSFRGSSFVIEDTVFINKNTQVVITGRDTEAGFDKVEYNIDNKGTKVYETPFIIEDEGFHKVVLTGYDKVENTSINVLNLMVDNTGPEVYHQFSTVPLHSSDVGEVTKVVYPKHVALFLSSFDKLVGYDRMYYQINTLAERIYSGEIKNLAGGKDYSIKVRALDKLGNQTEEEISFSVAN